jgi:hypothetical protein
MTKFLLKHDSVEYSVDPLFVSGASCNKFRVSEIVPSTKI